MFQSTVRNSVRTGTGHEYGSSASAPHLPPPILGPSCVHLAPTSRPSRLESRLPSRLPTLGYYSKQAEAGMSPNVKSDGTQGLRPVQRTQPTPRVGWPFRVPFLWLIQPWLESVGPMGGRWAGNLATIDSRYAGMQAYFSRKYRQIIELSAF